MRKQENTFDYVFYSQSHVQPKKLLLKAKLFRLFDLNFFPVGCDLSCPLISYKCIVINHSHYHCREHEPQFQIINNW